MGTNIPGSIPSFPYGFVFKTLVPESQVNPAHYLFNVIISPGSTHLAKLTQKYIMLSTPSTQIQYPFGFLPTIMGGELYVQSIFEALIAEAYDFPIPKRGVNAIFGNSSHLPNPPSHSFLEREEFLLFRTPYRALTKAKDLPFNFSIPSDRDLTNLLN